MRELKIDKLTVEIFPNRGEMGAKAAVDICNKIKELFGYNPKSVTASRNGDNVYAIVDYEKFSVTNNFCNGCGATYFGTIFSEDKTEYRNIDISVAAQKECDIFVDMVRNGNMEHSYEQLAAPVFYLNAVKESYDTGKKVDIKYEW